ncbi:MAG: GNAT family N-acetyltransferase, partial [Xanthomonadaceae bacterium]|nr:GNAT family N-acetyltransferase [Xanthomonadaceae bacterium]
KAFARLQPKRRIYGRQPSTVNLALVEGLEINVVPSKALAAAARESLLDLCSQAYQEDFTAYLQLLSPAVHVCGWLDESLVSHAAWVDRLLYVDDTTVLKTAYIEAVATHPDHQRRGFASAVLSSIPPLLDEYDLAALAPTDASYYRRLGWELWEGPLSYLDPSGVDMPTPEEQVMIYRLPRTPASLSLRAKLTTRWRPIEVW